LKIRNILGYMTNNFGSRVPLLFEKL